MPRFALTCLVLLFSSPAAASLAGHWLAVARPNADGTCRRGQAKEVMSRWKVVEDGPRVTVAVTGVGAKIKLSGRRSERRLMVEGISRRRKRFGRMRLVDAVYYSLEVRGDRLTGTRYLLSHRKLKSGVIAPCFLAWSVTATRARERRDNVAQGKELVDQMTAKMRSMLRQVEAANGDPARLKAIAEDFKKFAEKSKAEGDRIGRTFTDAEAQIVDNYARKQMAPLMRRFMTAVIKNGPTAEPDRSPSE